VVASLNYYCEWHTLRVYNAHTVTHTRVSGLVPGSYGWQQCSTASVNAIRHLFCTCVPVIICCKEQRANNKRCNQGQMPTVIFGYQKLPPDSERCGVQRPTHFGTLPNR